MTFRLMAQLTATAMLILPLTSCHVLYYFPCIAMACGMDVASIPPRNDPFSRALAQRHDLETIASFLAVVAQTQYDALGKQWPNEPQCAHIAAVGCRYSISVRVTRTEGFRVEPAGCALLDVRVVDGPSGRIAVQKLSYRAMQCPPKLLTPDGASTPAASSDARLP